MKDPNKPELDLNSFALPKELQAECTSCFIRVWPAKYFVTICHEDIACDFAPYISYPSSVTDQSKEYWLEGDLEQIAAITDPATKIGISFRSHPVYGNWAVAVLWNDGWKEEHLSNG